MGCAAGGLLERARGLLQPRLQLRLLHELMETDIPHLIQQLHNVQKRQSKKDQTVFQPQRQNRPSTPSMLAREAVARDEQREGCGAQGHFSYFLTWKLAAAGVALRLSGGLCSGAVAALHASYLANTLQHALLKVFGVADSSGS